MDRVLTAERHRLAASCASESFEPPLSDIPRALVRRLTTSSARSEGPRELKFRGGGDERIERDRRKQNG